MRRVVTFLFCNAKSSCFQETSKVVFKAVKSHESALYKVKCMNEHLMSTGDEDGTVKIWDKRKSPDGKHSVVMESKQFDEHVNDIFFDEAVDEKIMVASSGEGEFLLHFQPDTVKY